MTSLTGSSVPRGSVAALLSDVLDSPEISALIEDLDALRWTGQKGYGPRTMVGACLVRSLYALPTWTRTARLIAEHRALADMLGGTPSHWACYRFARKLREHSDALADCLDSIAAGLREALPEYGRGVAIDASDLAAYANGQRYVSKRGPERERFSDPDASWGHRSAVSTRKGGGFYGYKLHAAVDVATGLPVAWRIETAKVAELHPVAPLLDSMLARGFRPETVAADKGYDYAPVHEAIMERGALPIIARRRFAGEGGWSEAPTCEHGRWTFAGADFKNRRTKWRCPNAGASNKGQLALACTPASVWVKADRRRPLVPRGSKRFGTLYAGRAAVEREFGRLKNDYALSPLRVRGIERVALHADLTMLARLSQALALARARAAPLAA